MNQALFKRVLVKETGVVAWEYNEPFATLMKAHGAIQAEPVKKKQGQHQRRSATYQRRGSNVTELMFSGLGSKAEHVAEGAGFEPAGA